MVIRRDERIARLALGSANSAGRLKSGDAAPQIVEALALGLIDPDPDQPRRHFDDAELDALAASLRSVGQLQPIVVVRQDDRYRIHIGERRWRAAARAGLDTIRALVRATAPEARAARIAQIVENDQRAALTTGEMVDAVRDLQADGLKGIEIAEALAKPRSRISEYAALADAPADLRAHIDQLGLALSYQLMRQWRARPDATIDFLRHMPVEHISRLTIATIGEASPADRVEAERAKPATHPQSAVEQGRGEGAAPRIRLVAPHATSPADASASMPQDTVGQLVVTHPDHGEGYVVFGHPAPPDHFVIRFGTAAPHAFHKDTVQVLRAIAPAHAG